MIDPNVDNGGDEEQYAERGALDTPAPQIEHHDSVMADMTPEAPVDLEPIKIDHDEVMGELSGTLPTPPAPVPIDDDRPKEKNRGRYYVPPKQRTPENREPRRQEAQKRKEETGRTRRPPAEAPTLKEFFQQGGELPDPSEDDTGQSQSLPEAFFRLGAAQNSAILDLIRRVDQLAESIERARL